MRQLWIRLGAHSCSVTAKQEYPADGHIGNLAKVVHHVWLRGQAFAGSLALTEMS